MILNQYSNSTRIFRKLQMVYTHFTGKLVFPKIPNLLRTIKENSVLEQAVLEKSHNATELYFGMPSKISLPALLGNADTTGHIPPLRGLCLQVSLPPHWIRMPARRKRNTVPAVASTWRQSRMQPIIAELKWAEKRQFEKFEMLFWPYRSAVPFQLNSEASLLHTSYMEKDGSGYLPLNWQARVRKPSPTSCQDNSIRTKVFSAMCITGQPAQPIIQVICSTWRY